MGKKYVTDEQTLKGIANVIRAVGGDFVGEDEMTPEDMMHTKIPAVYHKGASDGIEQGRKEGIDEGKQAEYDRFWDNYQDNGNREHYTYAFSGLGWKKEIFKPKYDIIPSICGSMFYRTNMKIDMVDLLETQRIVLDLSKSTNVSNLCNNAYFTRFVIVNTTSAPDLTAIFSSNIFLEEVLGLVLKDDGSQKFSTSSFQGCSKLKQMPVSGTIGQNGFNVQWSTELTHDSLMSIINALQDKTADTSGTIWVVTIGETNKAKLTDDELGIAYEKGWLVE